MNFEENRRTSPNTVRPAATWCRFPGWVDVGFLILLWITKKSLYLEDNLFLAVVIAAGLTRYLLQVAVVGFTVFASRNWHIKQALILLVAAFLSFAYDPSTFTWLLSVYYAELSAIELTVFIYKWILKK